LVRNPLRASLTGLGILVGVWAVTVVITLGEGAELAVKERTQRLGENLITIKPRAVQASGAGNASRPILASGDALALAREVRSATHVAPVLTGLVRAVSGKRNAAAQAVGSTESYFPARGYRLTSGTIWDGRQEATAARVVVVGPTVVDDLFPQQDPIGRSIRIGRYLFRVIGVLEAKGQTPFGMDQDNVVVMPLRTMRSKVVPGLRDEVNQIVVAAAEGASTEAVGRSMAILLRQRHRIDEGEEDDFTIRDQARMAQSQQGIVDVMRMLLLTIAGVSLVIGGIGVMNIMLVSVAERSREIGTRLAVGARGSDILVQFLIEAVVLSCLGGALGAALAGAVVAPMESYFGWKMSLSPRSLAVAAAVSMAVGILFGLLPARRASLLDPVEALRRE
jgi:putative ABC transport system permease protein